MAGSDGSQRGSLVNRSTKPHAGLGHTVLLAALAFAFEWTIVPASSLAGANCSTIDDADQRALCRAMATNSVGQCSFIGDYALRQQCRVRLGASSNSCNTITDQWKRQKCLDEAKR